MCKLLNVIVVIITLSLIIFGIDKITTEDCYYVSSDKAVCEK